MLMLLEADRFTEFRSGLSMLIANKMEPNPRDQKMMTIQRNVIWFMPSFSQKKNIKLNTQIDVYNKVMVPVVLVISDVINYVSKQNWFFSG